MNFGGDHPAPGHGKISPRCVPKLPAMARLRPDAFPKGPRTRKTPVRGNISPACIQIQLVLARYARHASEKPRRAPLGNTPREHLAAKGRFRRPKPPNHARRTNLATPPGGPAPAQGLPPEQLHRGIVLQRLDPCPRGGVPPSEPQRGAPLGISLKEDEMRATPCINKCSTRCAVGYRIRICFEYQSVSLLA